MSRLIVTMEDSKFAFQLLGCSWFACQQVPSERGWCAISLESHDDGIRCSFLVDGGRIASCYQILEIINVSRYRTVCVSVRGIRLFSASIFKYL